MMKNLKKLNKNDEPNEDENEEELEKEDADSQNKVNIYNKQDFTLDKVLIFFKNEILATAHFCPICGKQMTLENNSNYMDEKVWRCRSKLMKHDIKKIYGKNLSLNLLIYHYL